jgi:hypothetical protein
MTRHFSVNCGVDVQLTVFREVTPSPFSRWTGRSKGVPSMDHQHRPDGSNDTGKQEYPNLRPQRCTGLWRHAAGIARLVELQHRVLVWHGTGQACGEIIKCRLERRQPEEHCPVVIAGPRPAMTEWCFSDLVQSPLAANTVGRDDRTVATLLHSEQSARAYSFYAAVRTVGIAAIVVVLAVMSASVSRGQSQQAAPQGGSGKNGGMGVAVHLVRCAKDLLVCDDIDTAHLVFLDAAHCETQLQDLIAAILRQGPAGSVVMGRCRAMLRKFTPVMQNSRSEPGIDHSRQDSAVSAWRMP